MRAVGAAHPGALGAGRGGVPSWEPASEGATEGASGLGPGGAMAIGLSPGGLGALHGGCGQCRSRPLRQVLHVGGLPDDGLQGGQVHGASSGGGAGGARAGGGARACPRQGPRLRPEGLPQVKHARHLQPLQLGGRLIPPRPLHALVCVLQDGHASISLFEAASSFAYSSLWRPDVPHPLHALVCFLQDGNASRLNTRQPQAF